MHFQNLTKRPARLSHWAMTFSVIFGAILLSIGFSVAPAFAGPNDETSQCSSWLTNTSADFFSNQEIFATTQLTFGGYRVTRPDEADLFHLAEVQRNLRMASDEITLTGRAAEVRTVIYPGAGHDAGSAFALFRRANLIIGIDNNPFFENPGDVVVGDFAERAVQQRGWSRFDLVGDRNGVAGSAVTQLKLLVPNFRLIELQVAMDQHNSIHGKIVFDTGAGTPIRTYLHIQGALAEENGWQQSWWAQRIFALGYQGVLIKASMHLFRKFDENETGPLSGRASYFVNRMAKNGGIVFDGDLRFSDFYDKSYPFRRYEPPVKFYSNIGYSGSDVILVGPWAKGQL